MNKVSLTFFTLLITWLILFDQQAVGLAVEYEDVATDEDILVTTENTNFAETTADFDYDIRNTFIFDNEIPAYSDGKKDGNKSESSSDDIIELNVGGKRITTLRSTLTAIPNSRLGLLFAKDNKTQTKFKSRQNKVHFFDYNPVQFEYLLDQLRIIKRMPPVPTYELNFAVPTGDIRFNFSVMLNELGMNPDRFLSPRVGTHVDLDVKSLIGWKMCYRGRYNIPFDVKILNDTCKGKRLLVACRTVDDKSTLIVAGVGKREDIFYPCQPNSHCTPRVNNGTGFYYVGNQAWGFQGSSLQDAVNYHYNGQRTFYLNHPCDASDDLSRYRLCWSLRSTVGRGGGDRCGSSKNLHNTKGWERLIYQTI